MSNVRRSTRLSISVKTPVSTTGRQTRNSGIWSRRDDCHNNSDELIEIGTTPLHNIESNIVMDETDVIKKNRNAANTPKSTRKVKPMPLCKKRDYIKRLQSAADNVKEINETSPPKQSKVDALPKEQLLTPSRLINRLNIKSDSEPEADFEESPEKREVYNGKKYFNKYQNARRILNSGETVELPGREEQLKELRKYFLEHLEEKRSGSLYISGQPGTGKTACLSSLLKSSEFQENFKSVYINCTSITSIGGIYKKLCNELKLKVTTSGSTERDYIMALENYLRNSKKMTLIVLDEIDQLCTPKLTILYTIFEWPSLPKVQLLLVGIANSLDLTERTLLRLNTRCELKPKHMHFPSYTKQQIVDIFKKRLEVANVMEVFPPATLQLLAAKVSAVSGDVRRALDIGRRVIELAEQQKKSGNEELNIDNVIKTNEDKDMIQPVQVTQVAAVLNKIYGASQNFQEDIEESLPLQQKLLLCSLILMLKKERNKDITKGRLYEVYRRVCNKRNIQCLDQTEFSGLIDLIETLGILKTIKKKEMRLCRIQLLWDEQEIYNVLKDKQLIASILHDADCLDK